MKSKLDPYDLAFQELLHEGKSKVSGGGMYICMAAYQFSNYSAV